jgi:hypothetical protein
MPQHMTEGENRPEPPQEPKKRRDASSNFISAGTLLLFGGGVELLGSQLGIHVDTRATIIYTSSLLSAGVGLTATGIIFRATKR